ncbi:MCP four helix bundle domain-containing protein [Echinicola jeungdonensis]|uniref:MCP four helix bundle domain-containing protein n=1 Tax=Echinicola jeungdonensis TaxID=709343 RepID=A0ABV5J5U4_9BACT|nr:MCP four helix bundle domain-containing protein [Echinicola jeungdonensis]MDN3670960.1 MCP four helix bundle domain-containing protein [Echinicola jeungdonensis]
MRWTYSIKNKLTIAALLAVVFFSVFVKNILDEEKVSDLTASFSTFYEDRLLPESYIFQLSDKLYQKQLIIQQLQQPSDFLLEKEKYQSHNEFIDSILVEFENTLLTENEAVYLSDLKENILHLKLIEEILAKPDLKQERFLLAKKHSKATLNQAKDNLSKLSDVQLAVGKALNDYSQKIRSGSLVLTRFEMAILVVLALLINALIFSSETVKSKFRQTSHLN